MRDGTIDTLRKRAKLDTLFLSLVLIRSSGSGIPSMPVQSLLQIRFSDPELKVLKEYDVWKEKKLYGKVSMGVVRTTYLIDEDGVIIKAKDKVRAAGNPADMLAALSE